MQRNTVAVARFHKNRPRYFGAEEAMEERIQVQEQMVPKKESTLVV